MSHWILSSLITADRSTAEQPGSGNHSLVSFLYGNAPHAGIFRSERRRCLSAVQLAQVIGWLLMSTSLPRLPAIVSSILLTLQPVCSVRFAR